MVLMKEKPTGNLTLYSKIFVLTSNTQLVPSQSSFIVAQKKKNDWVIRKVIEKYNTSKEYNITTEKNHVQINVCSWNFIFKNNMYIKNVYKNWPTD